MVLFFTFLDRTKKLSLGITVQFLWAKNFHITQNETTQWLDASFRDL